MTALDPDLVPGRIRDMVAKHGLDRGRALTAIDDDDCAVLGLEPESSHLVASIDYINASPVGIELGISDLSDLGWLCVAVNVADVVSTGAAPTAFLLAATMERGSLASDFDELVAGVLQACDDFNVPLVGGDTKLGRARAVAGCCIGQVANGSQPLLRSAARPGDDLWLLGELGQLAAAVLLIDDDPDGEVAAHAANAIRRPSMRYTSLHRAFRFLNSCTDISDGLAADAHAIARASSVELRLTAERLPSGTLVETAGQRGLAPELGLKMSIGGDLAFLASADRTSRSALESLGFEQIGFVAEGSGVSMELGGRLRPIPFAGHRDSRAISFLDEIRLLAGTYVD